MNKGSNHLARNSILVASVCLLAFPAHAQVEASLQEMAQTPVVTIRATETLKAKPDTASVHLSVETFGPTAASALEDNAAKMRRIIDALRRAGIPAARIQTSNFQLYPRYDSNRSPRMLEGYQARNSVRVTTTDLVGLGKLLDLAASAGDASFYGISFSLENDEQLRRTAREAALTRADDEAQFVARNRGFSSARVISVEADSRGRSGSSSSIIVSGERAGSYTPVETGEMDVGASVTVRYILLR